MSTVNKSNEYPEQRNDGSPTPAVKKSMNVKKLRKKSVEMDETRKSKGNILGTRRKYAKTKTEIRTNINKGVYKLKMDNTRSCAVWRIFAIITHAHDDMPIKNAFVCCTRCNKILKYFSISNLKKHSCYAELAERLEAQQKTAKEKALAQQSKLKEGKVGHNAAEDLRILEIETKLNQGIYKVKLQNTSKNPILSIFRMITTQPGNLPLEGYICCEKCYKVFQLHTDQFWQELKKHSCYLIYKKSWKLPNDIHMEINNLELKLTTGVYELETKPSSSQSLWSKLGWLCNGDGQAIKGFVACRQCFKVFLFEDLTELQVREHKCFQSLTSCCLELQDFHNWKKKEMVLKLKEIKRDITEKLNTGLYELQNNQEFEKPLQSLVKSIATLYGDVLKDFVCCTQCKMLLEYPNQDHKEQLKKHKCCLQLSIEHPDMFGEVNDDDHFEVRNECSSADSDGHCEEEQEFFETDSYIEIKQEITNPTRQNLKAMQRQVIENKIKSHSYKLVYQENDPSWMWQIYAKIQKEDGTPLDSWLYCGQCENLLESQTQNNCHLQQHACYKAFLARKTNPQPEPELELYANWILDSCNPVSLIDDLSFHKLAQHFMNLGAKYGEYLDMEDLMPNPLEISKLLQQISQEKQEQMKREIKDNNGFQSISLDVWPKENGQNCSVSVCLHFVKKFQLNEVMLGLLCLNSPQPSEAKTLQSELEKLLTGFVLEENLKNLIIVYDNLSMPQIQLKDYPVIPCASTLLAQVVDKAFINTPELGAILGKCKEIRKHLKLLKEYQNSQPPISFPTRCTSIYRKIMTISLNWPLIKNLLLEANLHHLLTEDVEKFLQFCQKFEMVFKKLQQKSQPSLCFVVPSILRLRMLCEKLSSNDDSAIKGLKQNLFQYIEDIFISNFSIWHKTAYFLYPPTNREQSQADLEEIKEFCLQQIDNLKPDLNSTIEVQPKKEKIPEFCAMEDDGDENMDDLSFFFPNLAAKHSSNQTKAPIGQEELAEYSQEIVAIDRFFDVLHWWHTNSSKYPLLSQLAIKILSIPASTGGWERCLAVRKNLMNEQRHCVSSKNVANVLLLKSLKEYV